MKSEVLRGVRLTSKTVEYVSFKVPRKSGAFAPEIFPPHVTAEPAMNHEEWLGGANKEPNR